MTADTLQSPASTSGDDVAAARRVLALGVDGLQQLADGLGERFSAAVGLLHGIAGKVVLSGMGKSGHIANKIAATLASTGAPALFVHPAEASHGDLGMITSGDAVIALSNSGGTSELSDIVAYTRRFAVPLIAMTRRRDSALAEAANVALVLPEAPEACPMGLAPTTSTTMMLALGDAIAIALLERKGFTAQDFHVLHPGGSLGRTLLRVADVMHGPAELPLCRRETIMSEAIVIMTERSFGCVGVTAADGSLLGIITDGDLRRHMSADLLDRPARDVMTDKPRTVRPQALAAEALGIMNGVRNERPITSLFVVEEGRPIGIVHIHECLRAGVA